MIHRYEYVSDVFSSAGALVLLLSFNVNISCVVFSGGVQILVLLGLPSVYQWSFFLTGLLSPKEVN